MNKARITYRTVMHPRIRKQDDRSWTMADYVSVPRLALIGTFNVGDMLSNDSIRNLLTAYQRARDVQHQREVAQPYVSRKYQRPEPRSRRLISK